MRDVLGALTLSLMISCGGGADGEELILEPYVESQSFGELYPLGNAAEDVSTSERVPYEWVLLLGAPNVPVEIEKVCLVGDTDFFIHEVSEPTTAKPGADVAVRITYERTSPNDGESADNAAIVIQSNATNAPTIVVPICARVIADGMEKEPLVCAPPVAINAGERDDSLCP